MDIVRATRCSSIPWAFALLLTAGPAAAQGVPYKVTGPDGRVTYTDRPPADARSVRPLGGAGAAVAPEEDWLEGLPFTLRQRAQRYPVTLYTAPGCAPCDLGRLALQQRGVPFREWRVEPDGGAAELQRREGTASLPVLRVGQQQLLGFEASEWRATLDAAGYPAASALPPSWQAPAAAALKAPPPATTKAPEGAPAAARAPAPAPATRADPPVGGFRF
jgi:glutaredoxin